MKWLFAVVSAGVLWGWPSQYVYQKVSMEMVTRSAQKGLVNTLKATVYYTSEGKMASLYAEPQPMLVTNNAKGEIMVYDFKNNSVTQKQNFMMSTETNQLFYFLENNKNDLGLGKMGFGLKETRFEDGLRITVWQPPMQLAKDISKVELAHERSNPVFMGYFDKKGKALNKVFFYNYQTVAGLQFPSAVTQITYTSEKDSVVSKTSYSNFKVDSDVDEQYLNFKVPSNAKVNN
jgi:outer membrane lipoprotein-sorting protein